MSAILNGYLPVAVMGAEQRHGRLITAARRRVEPL